MYLGDLYLQNLRIISHAQLEPGQHINLIYGKNGSGKTSVLESIHLLSRAKSFRTAKIREVIQRQQERLLVSAKLVHEKGISESIGIERSPKQVLLKYQQQTIKTASEQAKKLPLLTLSTESHVLLTGNPRERRKWLDWLMFHVEPDYLSRWKEFQSLLRQRNRLLREGAKDKEFDAWEIQMEKQSKSLSQQCSDNIHQLDRMFKKQSSDLLHESGEIYYQTDWLEEGEYLSWLRNNRQKDREKGYTSAGLHRLDIQFKFSDKKASEHLSRGQAKLYLTALTLAQAEFMETRLQRTPILLIDDVAAELDKDSREMVSEKLKASKIQCFLTTTERDVFEHHTETMFHVKRGEVEKMV